ncbi:MAG: hypothetical protein KatS3mg131_0264 [Candidatus Tectimicrobiota bacterium]|nr:MAG: hypothetical protein KatS3mg131_0264 [Candidatus Tectomicrobia bacterium]
MCIADATDVRKIRDACSTLRVDHLHYSGGTKPMAAHALQACGLCDSQLSYLDERKGLLRFDDGYDIQLDREDLGLTLELLLKLHGIERVVSDGDSSGTPTEHDATAVARYVLNRPEAADELRTALRPNDRRRNITQARRDPWRPPPELSLTVSVVPDHDWTNDRYKKWDAFLCGGWLERWIAALIRTCLDGAPGVVDVGVHCKRARPSPAEFEIDVAVVRRHRLYVVSCTTDRKKALCKSKLFEVSMRARQMGGDLARSALACLVDRGDEKGPFVEQLRADIASIWDAPNIPRVFGLADLREWAGVSGDVNLSTLKEWLDS